MRSKTTSNRAIRPGDGWRQRMVFSVMALAMMLLMPMASMAATYSFIASGDQALQANGTLTNSSGREVTKISGYDDHFAVWGGVGATGNGYWYLKTGGLYSQNGGNRHFSILNLQAGDQVKITYSGTISFLNSGKVEGKNAGDAVPNNETFYVMDDDGTLDLDVVRYTYISEIVIEAGTGSVTLTNNSGLAGYARWNPTTKKMETENVSASDGIPYYRVRLSSRWFDEPTVTVDPSWATLTWTVVNYGPSAGASYNPKTGEGKKTVAILDGTDLMFINPGWCKVIASYQGKSATYLVECWDNDANYKVVEQGNGLKYTFAANDTITDVNQQGGILQNRIITAVPGMEVKIGIPEFDEGTEPGADNDNSDEHHQPNTAVVQRWAVDGTDHYVSWVNDDRGWWDRYPNNDYSWPQQGSFYTFTATADGYLRLGGIKVVKDPNHNGNVYLVNFDNVGERPEIASNTAQEGYYTSDTNYPNGIELKAGQRYCLHGESASSGHAEEGWYQNETGEWVYGWHWVDTSNWSPFFLEWFSFEPKFAIREYYGIADKTGYEIQNGGSCESNKVIFATDLNGWSATAIEYKGHVDAATASIDVSKGTIKLTGLHFTSSAKDDMGGAVKVRLSKGTEGQSGYQYVDFVMTIPYGKHVWDFRQTAHQDQANSERFKPGDYSYTPAELVAMMDGNGDDWSRVYKVRHRANGHWTMLISPIMAARGSVLGNNAFYMDNTNGLVFLTSAESFGAEETSNEHGSEYEKDHGLKGIDDDEEMGYDYTTVTGADKVWIKGNTDAGASILFPGVKAGQYIKIYTYRHSDYRGEEFKAKNLVDLDNVAYNYNTTFLMRGFANGTVYPAMVGDNMRGCAIFRVPSNYTATNDPDKVPRLTLCDIGWAQIFRIEIMDEYEPDLLLAVDTENGYVPVEYDAVTSSIVVRGGTAEEREFLAIAAYTGCQNANTCEYKVYPDAGVNVGVTRSTWKSGGGVWYNNMKLKFNSGNGLVRIVQREKAATDLDVRNTVTDAEAGAAGYVIDKNEYYIAVGELNPQTYPYTWDFSTYNLYQNDSETKANLGATSEGEYGDWVADEDNEDGFGQHDKEVVDFGTGTFAKEGTTIDNVAQVAEVTRPLFAQGAQLSSGKVSGTSLAQNLIIETEGLGVRRPYGDNKQFPYLQTVDGVMQVDYRLYGSYDLEEGGINFDGNDLSGVGEITIPDVTTGMYVFVQSDAAPTSVTINGTAVDPIEKFDKYATDSDIPSGVYAYLNSGSTADVVLNFAKTTGITKIGVTNIHKEVNKLGYASESRDHAIDHTYTGQFTTSDVDAFGVTIYGDDQTPYDYKGYNEVRKTTAQVTVIPANTGCVLYGAKTKGRRYEFPLFYPACNVIPTEDDCEFLKTNWMAPNVEETVHTSETVTKGAAIGDNTYYGWTSSDATECTKFVMTTKYFTYKKNIVTGDGSIIEEDKEQEVESFYRVMISGDSSKDKLGNNKAYLLVPSEYLTTALWLEAGKEGYKDSDAGINMFYLDLAGYEDGDETDGIATVDLSAAEDNSVYYTLTGMRLNGKPTVKGIYVCNGKKVYVK